MKIVIIGTAYPLRGGLAVFNERLAEVLMQQGHDVEIITFSLQYPSFLFPGKSQFSEESAPKNLNISIQINSVNPFNWLQVGKKLQKAKPDLIIIKYWLPFMGPCFGTILRIAKKNKHTKVVSILDNVIPHEKRIGDVAFTKYFLNPVDAFVSMSNEVLSDLRTFEPNKPAVFSPHPVYDIYGENVVQNEAQSFLKLPHNKKYLLFFGFIRKYKGLDILLEAMTDERIKAMDIKLIVGGEYYSDQSFYEEIIKEKKLSNQLFLFTDFIPNDKVKYYFCAADCIVQPYRSATQSGISQIAYHFEKPMIVTNVGGLPEIVPNNKVGYVTEVSPKAIADAIVKFYTENNAANFASNLKIEKQKYSWDYFVENLMALLQ